MSGRWGGQCPECGQLYSAGGHAHVCVVKLTRAEALKRWPMPRKERTEAQEVDIIRRWIYRAFARELYKWFIAHGSQRIPMNSNSYAQIRAICHQVLVKRWTEPAWTIKLIDATPEQRAQRMGPTVVLYYKDQPV